MRIEPIPPEKLTAEQRPVYDAMKAGIDSTPGFKTFMNIREDGALLGPFNPWVREPKIGKAVWELTEAISSGSTLPKRVRQVVILATGARFNSAYELYAHSAVSLDMGISEAIVASLVAGQRPNELSHEESLAYDAATCIVGGAVLPQATYDLLVGAFGAHGTAELVYLTGLYCMVSATLNGFDVPVPGTR